MLLFYEPQSTLNPSMIMKNRFIKMIEFVRLNAGDLRALVVFSPFIIWNQLKYRCVSRPELITKDLLTIALAVGTMQWIINHSKVFEWLCLGWILVLTLLIWNLVEKSMRILMEVVELIATDTR